MVNDTKIGIDNIGFYIPKLRVPIYKIVNTLFKDKPDILERMHSAIKTTGQRCMRITQKWQDSVCLAAESIFDMLNNISTSTLRLIVSATETSVDASKPIAAYLLGIFKRAGGGQLSKYLSTFQTQHACAGGTISLFECMSMILALKKESSAIVAMTDIARYEKDTTAEVTQGAGSVSLFICKNPRLIELDIATIGLCSEDTDDFFRPINSIVAKVRGQFSMKCYLSSVYEALCDYAKNNDMSVEEVVESSDYFCFHLPFAKMSIIALEHILRKKLKWNKERIQTFLDKKSIPSAASIVAEIGNTYTASAYFSLGYLLCKEYLAIKDGIIGKKVLILSYGSGNTAVVMSGVIANQAPEIINSWSLLRQLENYTEVDETVYREWLLSQETTALSEKEKDTIDSDVVYLEQLRDDGYRVYNRSQ